MRGRSFSRASGGMGRVVGVGVVWRVRVGAVEGGTGGETVAFVAQGWVRDGVGLLAVGVGALSIVNR